MFCERIRIIIRIVIVIIYTNKLIDNQCLVNIKYVIPIRWYN